MWKQKSLSDLIFRATRAAGTGTEVDDFSSRQYQREPADLLIKEADPGRIGQRALELRVVGNDLIKSSFFLFFRSRLQGLDVEIKKTLNAFQGGIWSIKDLFIRQAEKIVAVKVLLCVAPLALSGGKISFANLGIERYLGFSFFGWSDPSCRLFSPSPGRRCQLG